jgi:hypothetical protein
MKSFLVALHAFLFLLYGLTSCETSHERAKKLNDEAIRYRIANYMKDPDHTLDVSDYTPLYYSELDTLTDYWLDSITQARYHLIHKYMGRNVASRWVKRSASVFLNEGLEVVDVKTILYHNPLHKDTLKARLRNED